MKLERCVRLCTENKTDIFFPKGLVELKLDVCNFFNRGIFSVIFILSNN